MIKKKKFDCVAMKLEIQSSIYNETNGMSPQELLEYYHEAVEKGPFAEKMKRIRARQEKHRSELETSVYARKESPLRSGRRR